MIDDRDEYNKYGTTYWGAPVTGSLLFCVITIAMGILFDVLYEKTNCIWVPALCHGEINAFAGVPTLFLNLVVVCDETNAASEKTILANGGVFEKYIEIDGCRMKRYWIDTD